MLRPPSCVLQGDLEGRCRWGSCCDLAVTRACPPCARASVLRALSEVGLEEGPQDRLSFSPSQEPLSRPALVSGRCWLRVAVKLTENEYNLTCISSVTLVSSHMLSNLTRLTAAVLDSAGQCGQGPFPLAWRGLRAAPGCVLEGTQM